MPSGVMTGHIAAQMVARAAIDEERVGRGVGAGSDHLGGEHGNLGMSLAEIEQILQALSFSGAGFQFEIAQPQLVDFGLQALIIRTRAVKIDIARPDAANFGGGPSADAADGSYEVRGPKANEAARPDRA